MQKRLDIYLSENNLVRSRAHATDLIKRGKIFVNGIVAIKQGQIVSDTDFIDIQSPAHNVGRGSEKLSHALDAFKITLKDKVVLDIGSSTGGFTDVALKEGAKKIFAIDIGSNQLDKSLLDNSKIIVMENTDIRNVTNNTLVDVPDIALVDVSFISLKEILPIVSRLIKKGGEVLALVKPQFESGVSGTKKGIVRKNNDREEALLKVKEYATEFGFKIINETDSPILGKKGNKEFFLYAKKN